MSNQDESKKYKYCTLCNQGYFVNIGHAFCWGLAYSFFDKENEKPLDGKSAQSNERKEKKLG